jgi:hypothetical protein
MIDIIFSNVVFWTAWFGISHIPFLVTQYAIDNYERVNNLKKNMPF